MCCAFLNFRGLSGCTHAPVSADHPTAHEGCMVLVSSHWKSLEGAPAASGKAEGGCQGSIPRPALFSGGPPGCWSLGLLAKVNLS